ncbi:hypothetical protein Tco_0586161 [Tanacetum coccineum]
MGVGERHRTCGIGERSHRVRLLHKHSTAVQEFTFPLGVLWIPMLLLLSARYSAVSVALRVKQHPFPRLDCALISVTRVLSVLTCNAKGSCVSCNSFVYKNNDVIAESTLQKDGENDKQGSLCVKANSNTALLRNEINEHYAHSHSITSHISNEIANLKQGNTTIELCNGMSWMLWKHLMLVCVDVIVLMGEQMVKGIKGRG